MNVELKRIAEKKLEQLGGDVCGVLVRKDEKLAAVDEHGRVQWLQIGQGAEPVAIVRAVGGEPHKWANIDWLNAGLLERGDKLYTQPQPAQQVSVPEGWSLTHIDDPATDGYLIKGPGISYCAWKDKEPWLYLFCEALVAPRPPKGDNQ